MATKVTLTIPEDLAVRLVPYRSSMNLSRLFASALDRELQLKTEIVQDAFDLAALVERLRTEKTEAGQRDYLVGFDDGMRYARSASYRELVQLARANEEAPPDEPVLLESVDRSLDYLYRKGAISEPADYRRGWLEGVLKTWSAVRDKL